MCLNHHVMYIWAGHHFVACTDHENGNCQRLFQTFNHHQKIDDYPCFLLKVSLFMFGLNRTRTLDILQLISPFYELCSLQSW